MSKVKVLLLRAPGINRDGDARIAFETAGASVVDSALVKELVGKEKKLADYQVLMIPGGFTYGDDISAGRIMANEIRIKLGDEIKKFVADGKLSARRLQRFPGPCKDRHSARYPRSKRTAGNADQ